MLPFLVVLAGAAPALAADAPKPADATVGSVRNRVVVFSPAEAPALVGSTLDRGNRIRTDVAASAELTLADGSVLRLGESTDLVLFGLGRSNGTKTTIAGETTLVAGLLRSRRSDASGAKPLPIVTDGARIQLGRGSARVSFDDGKVTRIAVYDGQSTLTGQRKDVVVTAGFGSKVERGKAPTPPQALPAAPGWRSAPPELVLTRDPTVAVAAVYQSGMTGPPPAQWHRLVARGTGWTDLVTDDVVAGSKLDLAPALGPGTYHVRLSSIDADKFEGPFSPDTTVRVVSLADSSVSAGTALAGLFCAIDGGALGPVAPDLALDRFHAHDLKCSTAADGHAPATLHLDSAPFELAWELLNASATTHTATLRGRATATGSVPVEHLTLAVKPTGGGDVDVFASPSPGVYEAKISWPRGTTRFVANVAANGEAHGEIGLALPPPLPSDYDTQVIPLPEVKTTFGELGLGAGFSGTAGGIGPLLALRGGVRHDIGKLELSANVLFSLEARSSDETGNLPDSLTGGNAVTSYATSERVYVTGLAFEGRYKLGASPFSAGVGVTPFIAIENASVSYFGGDVALPSPNTAFGANIVGVLHLAAGPGTISLDAGVRVSSMKDRVVVPVDMLGPYVVLGYRLAL